MERIPFDIKFRPEIEARQFLVETKDGKSVRIICWEKQGRFPIVALLKEREEDEDEVMRDYCIDGRYYEDETSHRDLFLVPNPDHNEPTTTCSTSEPSDAAVWAAVGAFKPDVWVTSDGRFRLTINAYHISQICGRCFTGEGPTIYAAAVEVYKQLKEGAK